jgi:hypothetical protein
MSLMALEAGMWKQRSKPDKESKSSSLAQRGRAIGTIVALHLASKAHSCFGCDAGLNLARSLGRISKMRCARKWRVTIKRCFSLHRDIKIRHSVPVP